MIECFKHSRCAASARAPLRSHARRLRSRKVGLATCSKRQTEKSRVRQRGRSEIGIRRFSSSACPILVECFKHSIISAPPGGLYNAEGCPFFASKARHGLLAYMLRYNGDPQFEPASSPPAVTAPISSTPAFSRRSFSVHELSATVSNALSIRPWQRRRGSFGWTVVTELSRREIFTTWIFDRRTALHFDAAGSFALMPAGMKHFAWATDEVVVQVHGAGPFQINYVNPADDPRGAKKWALRASIHPRLRPKASSLPAIDTRPD